MMVTYIAALLFVTLPVTIDAQSADPDISRYMSLIDNGQADQVRSELPSLLARYPNNPGVLFLQGIVTKEGAEAVRIYQSIVDNFPMSEWADAALYKVYQFYYALGLYRTAELKMNQLKKEYPASKYLTGSAEPETQNLAEEQEQPPASQTDETTRRAKTTDPQVQFALQVGAYTAQVNAEKQKLFFEDLGYVVEVISRVKDNRSLFLVLVGGYPTYAEAKAKSTEIKQTYNIDSIVISK